MKTSNSKLIICGTDTDIGKTVVSALLVQGLQSSYWKPIQTGNSEGTDSDRICKILNLSSKRLIPEIYSFEAPVSPHWAAEQESSCIELKRLNLPSYLPKKTIIEMAGGLMVPLTRNFLQLDLLQKWQLPIILVAKSGLGTINHTLLSLEALKLRKLPVIGIVFNGPIHRDNPRTIKDFSNIPIIAELPLLSQISSESLHQQWEEQNLGSKFEDLLQGFE